MLAVDPGVRVLACAAFCGDAADMAAAADLSGLPPAAWARVVAGWLDAARPDVVVVEAQRLDHGRCAFVEGLVHGAAAARGVPVERHVPRPMQRALGGFGGHARNKRRAVELVRQHLPAAVPLLAAAMALVDRRRTDTFDAALFVLWRRLATPARRAGETRAAAGPRRPARSAAPARRPRAPGSTRTRRAT